MIIGYLRVSTGKQHLENQQDEINRYARENNMMVDRWVMEVVSGKTEVRGRKLGRTIARMKRGDTLIVSEVSRLSRNLTDIMTIMGTCLKKGVNIHTTKERYRFDDSINSKILCFAFGLVAEIERNLISLRTKEALALRRSEGMKTSIPGQQTKNCDSHPQKRAFSWTSNVNHASHPQKQAFSWMEVHKLSVKTVYYTTQSTALQITNGENMVFTRRN